MTQLVIMGTIGYDDVETPFGKRKSVLGGTATYASYAASFFTKPGIVSIAGEDFTEEHRGLLSSRGIDLKGLALKGKTFRWSGSYTYDMNEAKTLATELNSLMDFDPALPEEYRNAPYVFLGNTDPNLQLKVIAQLRNPQLLVLDSMNYWISSQKERLLEVISKVNVLLLNDGEARQLFQTVNLAQCAKQALALGPQYMIIKKGEHGALLFSTDKHFNAPGYPLEVVKDPTGCGDSFAGAMMGYLAKTQDHSEKNLRKAIVYGSVIASFNAEDFSLERQRTLTSAEIEKRFSEMQSMREF